MQRNKIGYSDLPAFLGLFGLQRILVFMAFMIFQRIMGKELMKKINGTSTAFRDAFTFTIITSSFALAYIAAFEAVETLAIRFVSSILQTLIIGLSYSYYDRIGD